MLHQPVVNTSTAQLRVVSKFLEGNEKIVEQLSVLLPAFLKPHSPQDDVLLTLKVHGEMVKDPLHWYRVVTLGDSNSMFQCSAHLRGEA